MHLTAEPINWPVKVLTGTPVHHFFSDWLTDRSTGWSAKPTFSLKLLGDARRRTENQFEKQELPVVDK